MAVKNKSENKDQAALENENLYFEDIKGQENLLKARIHRNGKVHEITVLAASEASFNSVQSPYDDDSSSYISMTHC